LLWLVLRRCQYLGGVASDGKIISERRIENNLEGSGRGIFEILSRHMLEEGEENHGKPQSRLLVLP
jgi:hypothetical protein